MTDKTEGGGRLARVTVALGLILAAVLGLAAIANADPAVLFSDNFDGGIAGWTTAPIVNSYTGTPKNGVRSVRLRQAGSMERGISTVGYEAITVSFYLGASSLDGPGEDVQALWSGGAGWVLLKQISDGDPEEDGKLHYFEYTLPSAAANNSSFALRFCINGNQNTDYGYVDDVVVRGEPAENTLSISGAHGAVRVEGVVQSLPWSGTFAWGSEVRLEAVPEAGYEFAGWSGDLSGAENPATVTVDADKSVTAEFASVSAAPDLEVSANAIDLGTITGSATDASVYVYNAGGGSFDWTITGDEESWLTVTPGAGTTSNEQDYLTIEVDPTSLRSGAGWAVTGQDFPASLEWGETAQVEVAAVNNGSAPWTAAAYELRSIDTAGAAPVITDRWGLAGVDLAGTVPAGGNAVWQFEVTAPPLTTIAYGPSAEAGTAAVMSSLGADWGLSLETAYSGSFRVSRDGAPDDYEDVNVSFTYAALVEGVASNDIVVSRFPDVQPGTLGNWARTYIEECAGRVPAIVKGYPDGLFRPRTLVDRAAMAVFIARAMGLELQPYQGLFPDVPEEYWAAREIEALVRAKVVAGYPDGRYHGARIVTRDQMCVYVARARGWASVDTPAPDPVEAPFPDVPVGFWADGEIAQCVAHGIVQGYPDGNFEPTGELSRDQIAVFLYRAFVAPFPNAVVLGGPGVTTVDPTATPYVGWSSRVGDAKQPGYAYVVFDAVRLGPQLARPGRDGTWDVRFELRAASAPEAGAVAAGVVSLTPLELTQIRNAAVASGDPYCVVAWQMPSLPAGDYILVVSVETENGSMYQLALTPEVSVH